MKGVDYQPLSSCRGCFTRRKVGGRLLQHIFCSI
nr:MAG TPA: hypothetical protein [Caudoviricetes sp.]